MAMITRSTPCSATRLRDGVTVSADAHAQNLLVVLGRVVVQKRDHVEAQLWVVLNLPHDDGAGVARAHDDDRLAHKVAVDAAPSCSAAQSGAR